MKYRTIKSIKLDKFVHGGQCIAEHQGKKLFVWGGLPGETVDVLLTKKKSSYLEGIATSVEVASKDRIEPLEPESYISTSPWQVVEFKAENSYKQQILEESFGREKISLEFSDFFSAGSELGYRNKQEFGFWGDDDGLHLAHFRRGSHGKQMIDGSALTNEFINQAARDVRDQLNKLSVWGGHLKTLMLRSSAKGDAVAALFVKTETESLKDLKLPDSLQGLDVYYSNPQSPASVPTRKLYSLGDINLSDSINGINITYDVLSFFQVNLPVFDEALSDIKNHLGDGKSVDLYSGVGTIGIAVASDILVESDNTNIKMAEVNASGSDIEVVHATTETALQHITGDRSVIVDPPRAGLHKDVVAAFLDAKPAKILYLSCNPSTQARDVAILSESYDVKFARGYNFFPRTPHIECLVVLELK
ncbi:MAG: 23S rRNA (uracil1939-C5)-methyltransferase [Candidatus Saccharimonadales bacterium]|jgi:23S rRNA (uracil1939-C5)-methyltransferase